MFSSPKSLVIFFAGLAGCGWLVPNHYFPWLSAWGDGLSIAVLLVLAAATLQSTQTGGGTSRSLICITAICGATLLVQWLSGRILFSGDAVIVGFYIAVWIIAVVTGSLIVKAEFAVSALNTLTTGWVIAALLSVGIGIVQWTSALNLGIYVVDFPAAARPFANVAQPNHLATICLIALCSLLWLYERQEVRPSVFWLGVCFLLFGMAMTQSRTGSLQIGLLLTASIATRRVFKSRVSLPQLAAFGSVYAAFVLVWPRLCDVLLLSAGRPLSEQLDPGVRLPYWRSMLDAISQEPWLGYGWQQVGGAQQRVALEHPPIGIYFEHSHNFLMDLLLWNGIPVGVVVACLLAWWFVFRIRAIADAGAAWLFAMVSGILLHGMLEFPLEYAYFLIPLGLVMGVLEGLSPSETEVRVPRKAAALFVGFLAALFAWIASEYLSIEEAQRTLSMESARIGVPGISTPIQPRRLLNQLEAFQRFASLEATPSMSTDQLEWMRKVSYRFGYPSVLFRYALAAGLNDQPDIARATLDRICRIHSRERCDEAHTGWLSLQLRYAQLLKIAPPIILTAGKDSVSHD